MIETTGYYFDLWDDKKKFSPHEEATLTSFEKKIEEKKVNKKADEIFAEQKKVLL